MERKTTGRNRRSNPLAATMALVMLASMPGVALHAGEPAPAMLGPQWTPVPPERLEHLRGGFELPSGLLVSFGIERLVHVNGQLVASARLNVAGGQVDGDLSAFNQTLLVQVGEGNSFQPTGMGGVAIQNTLDNQDIRVSTRIDTQVGTLGVFQAIQQQDALQGALAGAVLP